MRCSRSDFGLSGFSVGGCRGVDEIRVFVCLEWKKRYHL